MASNSCVGRNALVLNYANYSAIAASLPHTMDYAQPIKLTCVVLGVLCKLNLTKRASLNFVLGVWLSGNASVSLNVTTLGRVRCTGG